MMLRSTLPRMEVTINGKKAMALIDRGCETTLVTRDMVNDWSGTSSIMAVDGREVKCDGTSMVGVTVRGTVMKILAIVTQQIVLGVDIILGMDVITRLGGVTIKPDGVQFELHRCASSVQSPEFSGKTANAKPDNHCVIEDKDFHAEFNGTRWTVKWVWKGKPPVLRNKVGCYGHSIQTDVLEKFEKEVDRWIEEGILVPWEGKVQGVLPLMAVSQPIKNKIRPILDYRELNEHVACHTRGDATDVCGETMRKWRRMQGVSTMVDLKRANL